MNVLSASDTISNPPRLTTMEKKQNAILCVLTKNNLFWHSGFTTVYFNVRGKRGYRTKGPVITCALCRRFFRGVKASTRVGRQKAWLVDDESARHEAECKIRVGS